MRVKWPIAGVAFVGTASVVSYVYNRPNPDAGVVIGLIAVAALVILAVVLLDLYARHIRTKP